MNIEPIGWVETCFDEKFAVPRQSGLCPSSWGILHFHRDYQNADMLRGLEGFSHVWLIFSFHQNLDQGWTPTVRPPRLGGNRRVGVFATRSTFRPNGLGLSVCRLEKVDLTNPPRLHLGGLDLVSGTPVFDVKPYLAYCDVIEAANSGYASSPPLPLPVEVLSGAAKVFEALPLRTRSLIIEVLAQDPRPAIHDDPERVYGVALSGWDVRFRVAETVAIIAIEPRCD